MGSWELGAVPINGAFTRGNESQTTVWTVTDNGSLLMSIGSTASTSVYGLEIDIDNTTVNATNKHNLVLKQSSTKAGTTRDSFIHMELGSENAVVTSCFSIGSATVDERPSYFLTIASTAASANAGGMVDERIAASFTTTTSKMAVLACLIGTGSYYLPLLHASNVSSSAAPGAG